MTPVLNVLNIFDQKLLCVIVIILEMSAHNWKIAPELLHNISPFIVISTASFNTVRQGHLDLPFLFIPVWDINPHSSIASH